MLDHYKKQREKRLKMRIQELESRKILTKNLYEGELQDIDGRIDSCQKKLDKIIAVRKGELLP